MIHIITTKALRTLTGERDIARAHAEKQLERARYYRDMASKIAIEESLARRRVERLRRSEAAKKGHATRTHKQAVNDPIVAAALELRG